MEGAGGAHLFEELVVGLFGGADFDGFHHFAGGDDDAAEDSGWGAGHCWRGLGVDGEVTGMNGLNGYRRYVSLS